MKKENTNQLDSFSVCFLLATIAKQSAGVDTVGFEPTTSRSLTMRSVRATPVPRALLTVMKNISHLYDGQNDNSLSKSKFGIYVIIYVRRKSSFSLQA